MQVYIGKIGEFQVCPCWLWVWFRLFFFLFFTKIFLRNNWISSVCKVFSVKLFDGSKTEIIDWTDNYPPNWHQKNFCDSKLNGFDRGSRCTLNISCFSCEADVRSRLPGLLTSLVLVHFASVNIGLFIPSFDPRYAISKVLQELQIKDKIEVLKKKHNIFLGVSLWSLSV